MLFTRVAMALVASPMDKTVRVPLRHRAGRWVWSGARTQPTTSPAAFRWRAAASCPKSCSAVAVYATSGNRKVGVRDALTVRPVWSSTATVIRCRPEVGTYAAARRCHSPTTVLSYPNANCWATGVVPESM